MSLREEIYQLYDRIDQMYQDGKFDEVNEEIKVLDVPGISTQLLVSWLTVTNWAKTKLPDRRRFVSDIKDEFERRGLRDRIPALTRGID